MIDVSRVRKAGVERVKVAEGDLSHALSLDEVAPFRLHDVLIFKYEINNPLDSEAELMISGLLPDWRSIVELFFSEVIDFDSQAFSYFQCFSVNELRLAKDGGNWLAYFDGLFENQFFSFKFGSATYEKYDLKAHAFTCRLGLELNGRKTQATENPDQSRFFLIAHDVQGLHCFGPCVAAGYGCRASAGAVQACSCRGPQGKALALVRGFGCLRALRLRLLHVCRRAVPLPRCAATCSRARPVRGALPFSICGGLRRVVPALHTRWQGRISLLPKRYGLKRFALVVTSSQY